MIIDIHHWNLDLCECGHGMDDHEHEDPAYTECWECPNPCEDTSRQDWGCDEFRPRVRAC